MSTPDHIPSGTSSEPAASQPPSEPATPNGSPQIELIDVTVGTALAPDSAKVEGVNWRIWAGDYWVVGGSPGSGKTELMATAAGLTRPRRGVYRLFGQDMNRLAADGQLDARLRVGMVYDGGGRLFHQMTVAQNVALPFCYHRNCSLDEANETVGSLLELMGLSRLAYQRVGGITWSLRQRVGWARALVLRPEALFLDNPLVGLDAAQIRWSLEFLSRLADGRDGWNNRRTTLVVSTADFRPWQRWGRQFALLNQGRWLQLGGPAELGSSQEPLVRQLLSAPFAAG